MSKPSSSSSSSSKSFQMWLNQDPTTLWTAALGLGIAAIMLVRLVRKTSTGNSEDRLNPTPKQVLHLIQNRRTISAKDYLPAAADPITEEELQMLLEAANWAPTHGRTEPWRFVVISGQDAIIKYLGFLEGWYTDNVDKLSEEASVQFHKKFEGILKVWPTKASHLLLIVMKRQSLPEKLMPEWEEMCAVAMAVQNLHLMATSLQLGVFWSSHTWCRDARDSREMKRHFNFEPEDKVLGVLTLGRYDTRKSFTSARRNIQEKLQYRC